MMKMRASYPADANVVSVALSQTHDPLAVLRLCGGLYICPKDGKGRRKGPLVAYRGTYDGNKRYVGDIYANWAKVEAWPTIAAALAERLSTIIAKITSERIDVFCGAPEGGKHLADKLAMRHRVRYVYPEKKDDKLVWGRHEYELREGDNVAIVEDVSNNFSTTDKLIGLIQQTGAIPVVIATYLNRSPTIRDAYRSLTMGCTLPIAALVSKPFPEYRQDHPEVKFDFDADNVAWSAKSQWHDLLQIMNKA